MKPQPIGCWVERSLLADCKRAAGTSSHASRLRAVSCRPEENGNKWFVCSISTELCKGDCPDQAFRLNIKYLVQCNQLFSL